MDLKRRDQPDFLMPMSSAQNLAFRVAQQLTLRAIMTCGPFAIRFHKLN